MNVLKSTGIRFQSTRVPISISRRILTARHIPSRLRIRRFPIMSAGKSDTAILEKVKDIISNQLGKDDVDKEELGEDKKLIDLGADSLDQVEIMMALEEEFDIEINEEDSEKLTTIKEVADLIQKQIEKV